MNAPPDRQLRLLDLQAVDSALDRLTHRRRTLPETERIAALGAELDRLADDVIRAETADADLAREQTRLENDVDLVRSRAARDRQRLASGSVGSPRELENLQSEVGSLARRQDALEEQVLEVMERRDEVQGRLRTLVAERDRLTGEQAEAQERATVALAGIGADEARHRQERTAIAGEIPPDLLTLYEKIRADKGGIGAAALYRGRCEGCHLSQSGQELAALRAAPPELVARCEDCRRILVRTPESGL